MLSTRSFLSLALSLALAIGASVDVLPARSAEAPVEKPDPRQREYERLLGLAQRPPAPALETAGPAGVTARDMTFESKTLGRKMRYRALLPASYGRSHRHYPVLYMLHGYMNASHEWDQQSQLARLLDRDRLDLIVVLPQFDNSFYLNANSDPKAMYMRYFFRDLLPEVETRFRARSEPPARAIAGVSMGGYGAMLYGLRYPQAFSFVASFSGCLGMMQKPEDLAQALQPFDLMRIVGPADSTTREANDPIRLIGAVDVKALPPIWITCGTQDYLFEQNLDFVKVAAEREAPMTFVTGPGQHEWVFWDAQLPSMFAALRTAMGVELDDTRLLE